MQLVHRKEMKNLKNFHLLKEKTPAEKPTLQIITEDGDEVLYVVTRSQLRGILIRITKFLEKTSQDSL